MAKPYESFFRKHVNPYFSQADFNRAGKYYHRENEFGDSVSFHFQGSVGSYAANYQFFVNVSVSPASWVAFQNFQTGRLFPHLSHLPPRPPHRVNGLIYERLRPTYARHWWEISDEIPAQTTWSHLQSQLDQYVPLLVSLLDRDRFLRALHHDPEVQQLCHSPEVMEAALLAGGPDKPALEQVLAVVAEVSKDEQHAFETFMRQYPDTG